MSIIKRLFCFVVIGFFLASLKLPNVQQLVYLTYTQDPSTSISVHWHTQLAEKDAMLFYRQKGESQWRQSEGTVIAMQEYDYAIHRVDLSNLQANTYYEFHITDPSVIHIFRTLPEKLDDRGIKFVVGGDVFRSLPGFQKMNKVIAEQDPDFIVIGGDIAYTIGAKKVFFKKPDWEMRRWITFFSEWNTTMVGKEGRLIPILPVVGNHDVPPGRVDPTKTPVLLYQLFAFKQDNVSYRTLDIGSYLSLFLLDTDHSYPIEGKQSEWLRSALSERSDVPYKFAAYHISAYPSVYRYKKTTAKKIREHWSPLFEDHGVQLAFEHHNHAYKRTFPIKKEAVDPTGVVYMGDGSWGVSPRSPFNAWYLEKRMKQTCVNVIDLSDQGCQVSVFNQNGKVLDSIPSVLPK
jgi:acid phosphatase type 7